MGYNKVVVSGTMLETYEYEKNIHQYQRPRIKSKADVPNTLLATDGTNPFSTEALGKRRDNARRAQQSFSRLVRSNIDGLVPPLLITLTYKENEDDLGRAYRDFTACIQAMRYRYGKVFRYVAVPEFQSRGAVHFHALFWGLPEGLLFRERQTRELATIWSLGFVYLKPTDGSELLSWYLSKYMAKAYLDPRLGGYKAFVASRNVVRPREMKNIAPLWPVLEDYGISTAECLHEKQYMTQWLGRGKYRRYQLKKS